MRMLGKFRNAGRQLREAPFEGAQFAASDDLHYDLADRFADSWQLRQIPPLPNQVCDVFVEPLDRFSSPAVGLHFKAICAFENEHGCIPPKQVGDRGIAYGHDPWMQQRVCRSLAADPVAERRASRRSAGGTSPDWPASCTSRGRCPCRECALRPGLEA